MINFDFNKIDEYLEDMETLGVSELYFEDYRTVVENGCYFLDKNACVRDGELESWLNIIECSDLQIFKQEVANYFLNLV